MCMGFRDGGIDGLGSARWRPLEPVAYLSRRVRLLAILRSCGKLKRLARLKLIGDPLRPGRSSRLTT